jgi:hypothetical protein
MRIVIQPSEEGYPVDGYELQRTLDLLRDATIQTQGGAIVSMEGARHGVVTLRAKADMRRAMDVLKHAGIRVSE